MNNKCKGLSYKNYLKKKSAEFNELPIKFAYNEDQFKNMLAEWGMSRDDKNKIIRLGTGVFCLKDDYSNIINWEKEERLELESLMEDRNFAVDAYFYEMCNHEYSINWDGDWDVLQYFGKEDISDLNEIQQSYYSEAKAKYLKKAEECGWY